jgi:hypothetical protein
LATKDGSAYQQEVFVASSCHCLKFPGVVAAAGVNLVKLLLFDRIYTCAHAAAGVNLVNIDRIYT